MSHSIRSLAPLKFLFQAIACAGLCLLLSVIGLPLSLHAQTVYRCGSTYSHTPCPNQSASSVVPRASPSRSAQRPDGPVQSAPLSVLHGSTDAPPGQATVYLCQTHAGSKFWSHTACNAQQALMERMESVPSSLNPQQRIQQAQAQWEMAQRNAQADTQPAPTRSAKRPSRHIPSYEGGKAADRKAQSQCMAYRAQLEKIDTQARAGGSRTSMDQWTNQRKAIRAEMRAHNC